MENKEQEMIAWVNKWIDTTFIGNGRAESLLKQFQENFNARFAPKPMTFAEAVEAMKQGKKVRRAGWMDYIRSDGIEDADVIWDEGAGCAYFSLEDFTATDWQIFEEGV